MAASKPALNGAAESWAGAANWKDLDESVVDPITLEPIADLAVAPFRLKGFLFDAEALACYLVASSRYENPLDRSALTSAECRALDGHLAAHGLRAMRVAQERVAAEKRKAKAASEAEARAAAAAARRAAAAAAAAGAAPGGRAKSGGSAPKTSDTVATSSPSARRGDHALRSGR